MKQVDPFEEAEPAPTKHYVRIDRERSMGIRDYWECSCGRGGSTIADTAETVSEKHVPDGDRIVYQYPCPSSRLSGDYGDDWRAWDDGSALERY